jgi:calcineurin-like phosphoesterase family protein
MPSPERLRKTLQRAIAAFRTTPGRCGRVVTLQDATEVLATGDLHGNLGNFQALLDKADLVHHVGRHLVLQEVIHGPHRCYPGGGDKSHQLLDLVAALKCEFPTRLHFLPGNHELAQATERKIGKEDDDLNQRFRVGVAEAYAPNDDAVYALYGELIAAAPLVLRTANRVLLCHSLPNRIALERFDPAALERDVSTEADLLPGGSVYALLWGRDTREQTVIDFLARMDGDLLITGHIPSERGFEVPNSRQVILDCLGDAACYCLFPADRPLSHGELVGCVGAL